MDYQNALKELRAQVFTEPAPQVKKETTGFIPIRNNTQVKAPEDTVKKSVEWLKEIRAASEEIKTRVAKAQKAVVVEEPVVPRKRTIEEDAAPLIARRGDRPSPYAPDVSAMNFDGDWAAVSKAIKDVESGGDYSARGPVVAKGAYKGQRAMGAYQVMPGNLPSWSKAAVGREVTEEEFMNSPDIQDAIFLDQMKKAKDKHGTIEDAVSVWFSGRPVKSAGNASDGYVTSPEYVSKFKNRYNAHKTTAS